MKAAPESVSYSPIRLAELSVFNWGSFHGLHTGTIHPDGTLITGDNGSGKSTFIDGLMALLLPAGRAAFNVAAAQGDRSDRSLISYMRGSFGSDHDGSATRTKSKREKAVITGLRALYRAEDGGETTLLALFWTAQAGNALADVKRLYVVARHNLSLKTVLDRFGSGNVRGLKQWLRGQQDVYDCDDNFANYQELYRRFLHLYNPNAPALLSRALGLKKIDDLTRLIRELVLEPADIRSDARSLVAEFADLESIYARLSDARAQVQHLHELPAMAERMRAYGAALAALQAQRSGLAVYFARAHTRLWEARLVDLMDGLKTLLAETGVLRQRQQDAEEDEKRRYRTFYDCGGARIEELKQEIARIRQLEEHMAAVAADYQQDCRLLGLPADLDAALFRSHQQEARRQTGQAEAAVGAQQDRFSQAAAALGQTQSTLAALEEEIRAVEARPDSNIPARQQQWRDELQQALGLAHGEAVFVGEMLDVRPEEHEWRGAIERALGGLRTTLLVPEDDYPRITRWLNSRHLSAHIRVQLAHTQQAAAPAFAPQGLMAKLLWREHPYRNWLQQHLAKRDLTAVASAAELDNTPFSITREGLQHWEHGRFEKKDHNRIDDRRHWYLGFSNRLQLAQLQEEAGVLQAQVRQQQQAVAREREALNRSGRVQQAWHNLQRYRWQDIDVPHQQARLQQCQADLRQLEAADGDLQAAKRQWEAAQASLKAVQQQLAELGRRRGRLEQEQENAEERIRSLRAVAKQDLDDTVAAQLAERTGTVSLADAAQQQAAEQALEREVVQAQQRQKSEENRAINIISSFKGREKWQPLTAEWGVGLDGLGDAIEHVELLEREGLPKLVEQFRERLNKHTTQSLTRLRNRLDNEYDEIRERIAKINRVLAQTEFRPGTYLKLGSRREKFTHVQLFEHKVKAVLGSGIHDEDPEHRFMLLKEVIDILAKASSRDSAYTLESLRLLDPRYQLAFFAEEIDHGDKRVRDVLNSSSGKSGGEKEAFAGMVVAASLAYVLTPDDHDSTVYRTVFLDEAFSNTAETVSRRVLRVFKELNIHVNLITPFKNLNLARESARSLLIAERDADSHESRLCEMTWEEIDAQQAEHLRRQLAQGETLGIEWEGA